VRQLGPLRADRLRGSRAASATCRVPGVPVRPRREPMRSARATSSHPTASRPATGPRSPRPASHTPACPPG